MQLRWLNHPLFESSSTSTCKSKCVQLLNCVCLRAFLLLKLESASLVSGSVALRGPQSHDDHSTRGTAGDIMYEATSKDSRTKKESNPRNEQIKPHVEGHTVLELFHEETDSCRPKVSDRERFAGGLPAFGDGSPRQTATRASMADKCALNH